MLETLRQKFHDIRQECQRLANSEWGKNPEVRKILAEITQNAWKADEELDKLLPLLPDNK